MHAYILLKVFSKFKISYTNIGWFIGNNTSINNKFINLLF